MGLESVELVLEVEETFDIAIADDEAASVFTVGDLHALILRKVDAVAKAPCLTAHVFYQIRRALLELYEVPRIELAPARTLTGLIPMENRRAHWESLSASLNLGLPALRRPRALVLALNGSFLSLMIGVAFAGALGALSLWMTLSSLSIAAILWVLSYRLTRPLAAHLRGMHTLGDLARAVLRLNTATLAATRRAWSPRLVWEVLTMLMAERHSLDLEKITPEARLGDDLGID